MTEYLLFKLLHLLLFVYWLGGDLGTFYASRFVAKQGVSAQQRKTALTIMMGVDQGPRICMALILGPGMQMAHSTGLIHLPWWGMMLVWSVCAIWLALVLMIHFSNNRTLVAKLSQFDFKFRIVVIVSCLLLAIEFFVSSSPQFIQASYIAWKLILFALLVACGLGIRVQLKPFVSAFGEMLKSGPNAEVDGRMATSLAKVRPFVYVIWCGLLVNAAIGLHLISL
ncbi:hypothetical protein [Thalassotalea maritima]|uniref:hypothetical protein n=1 Tax=Thalassotalea maritima TaxID=3242416 RepID=UPI003526F980